MTTQDPSDPTAYEPQPRDSVNPGYEEQRQKAAETLDEALEIIADLVELAQGGSGVVKDEVVARAQAFITRVVDAIEAEEATDDSGV